MGDTSRKRATQADVGGRRKSERGTASKHGTSISKPAFESLERPACTQRNTRITHRPGDLQPPMRAKRPRRCVDPSASWGALCPDVRGHILSKLSLREHALAASVCREFLQDFVDRVAKERASSISLAEEVIGKPVFNSFVNAVQRLMCGLPPHPKCPPHSTPLVDWIINATGETKLMTESEKTREAYTRARDEGGAIIWKVKDANISMLTGNLFVNVPGSCKWTYIFLRFSETHDRSTSESPNTFFKVHARFWSEGAAAFRGLMVAICTGNPAAIAAHWKRPLREISFLDLGHDAAIDRAANGASELLTPPAVPYQCMNCVYYGSGLDLDGESARGGRARRRAAAHAVAAAGMKAWGSDWHGEGLGLCAFLLSNPTT